MTPDKAEKLPAQRTSADVPALTALRGRFVQRYFDGYGLYTGKVTSIDEAEATAVIVYEDGASENLFLDQVQQALLPKTFRPPHAQDVLPGVEEYGCTWPPPSVSQRLILNRPRRRKPSAAALERMLVEEALKFEREARRQAKSGKKASTPKKRTSRQQQKRASKPSTTVSSSAASARSKPAHKKRASPKSSSASRMVKPTPVKTTTPEKRRSPAAVSSSPRRSPRQAGSKSATGSTQPKTRQHSPSAKELATRSESPHQTRKAARHKPEDRNSRAESPARTRRQRQRAHETPQQQQQQQQQQQREPQQRGKAKQTVASQPRHHEAAATPHHVVSAKPRAETKGQKRTQPSSQEPQTRRRVKKAHRNSEETGPAEKAPSSTLNTRSSDAVMAAASEATGSPIPLGGNIFRDIPTPPRPVEETCLGERQQPTANGAKPSGAAEQSGGPGEPAIQLLGPSRPMSKALLAHLRKLEKQAGSGARASDHRSTRSRRAHAATARVEVEETKPMLNDRTRTRSPVTGKRVGASKQRPSLKPVARPRARRPASRTRQAKARQEIVANTDSGAQSEEDDENKSVTTANSPLVVETKSPGAKRTWALCSTCKRKHWSTEACPSLQHPDSPSEDLSGQVATMRRKWTGTSTSSLLEILESRRDAGLLGSPPPRSSHGKGCRGGLRGGGGSGGDAGFADGPGCADEREPLGTQQERVDRIYRIINRRHDITCGADGRYGITGHATKGSMTKMMTFLQNRCGLGPNALFLDIGHGMGRPNFHAASLRPPVKASVGTEYNPQLYKQSMLILRELTEQDPSYLETPSIFFMDRNIRDISSIEPFTHVYCFNIGMPDDVLRHLFRLIEASKTVKYVVLFPHRFANTARIEALGRIMCSFPMHMPGGCAYEANVVEINRKREENGPSVSGSADPLPCPAVIGDLDPHLRSHVADADEDVQSVFRLMDDPALYKAYVSDLGTAGALEFEEQQLRSTRASRRRYNHTQFLAMSPCLPDIPMGLLRRVCLGLGISSTGEKVDLLANIQAYAPQTFGISLFATGHAYSSTDVDHILQTLLAKEPSRRQPELA